MRNFVQRHKNRATDLLLPLTKLTPCETKCDQADLFCSYVNFFQEPLVWNKHMHEHSPSVYHTYTFLFIQVLPLQLATGREKKEEEKQIVLLGAPLCNPAGSPRGQQRDLVLRTPRGGVEGLASFGWSFVRTRGPHLRPQTRLPRTRQRHKHKNTFVSFAFYHIL